MIPTTAIRPETVARKLAAADSLQAPQLAEQLAETPRLIELLWFIQWWSFQPGGIWKLVADFLAALRDGARMRGMREAGEPGKDGRWTRDQCLAAWRQNYRCSPQEQEQDDDEAFLRMARLQDEEECNKLLPDFCRWARGLRAGEHGFSKLTAAQLAEGMRLFNRDYFALNAAENAAENLPAVLKDFCEAEGSIITAPRWFPSLVESLFAFMDQHAARERARLAMTEVALKVFDALDFAWAERKLVRITGSSRFGKTESVKTKAAMHPGRWRLFTAPCSNSLGDLVRAVAEALGMPASYGSRSLELRGKVEFVLKHGRIGFVADECHFLFPIRYGNTSSPDRLNWLRTQIVDRRLPCALVSTPQAYDGQRKRFDRATGYNMEQFTGRTAMSLDLPDRLSVEDMTAVARLHFPELRESLVGMAVGAAKQSQSYLKAIEDIASRARWLASKRSASAIVLRDLESAIKDVVPGLSEPATEIKLPAEDTGAPSLESPAQRRGRTAADTLREVCTSRISGRTPGNRGVETETQRAVELMPA